MSRRLLATALLSILVTAGFLLIFRSNLPFISTIRRDTIPQGAYVVPWMEPTVSLLVLYGTPPQNEPWNLIAIMPGSLVFDMSFQISMKNGTRVVPSTIYLGHDANVLYLGGTFRGMFSNPNSYWNKDNVTYHLVANYIKILLDIDNDGHLSAPEGGSAGLALVPCPFQPTRCGLGHDGWGSADLVPGYADLSWVNMIPQFRHGFFDLSSNVCNQPSTLAGIASEYNYITGDLTIIFAKRLNQGNSCSDGLQMRTGERWVMGFLFELGYSNDTAPLADYVNGWPLTAYPYYSSDCSSWPKLSIDLGNPPSV